jgi:hypothetical protein
MDATGGNSGEVEGFAEKVEAGEHDDTFRFHATAPCSGEQSEVRAHQCLVCYSVG